MKFRFILFSTCQLLVHSGTTRIIIIIITITIFIVIYIHHILMIVFLFNNFPHFCELAIVQLFAVFCHIVWLPPPTFKRSYWTNQSNRKKNRGPHLLHDTFSVTCWVHNIRHCICNTVREMFHTTIVNVNSHIKYLLLVYRCWRFNNRFQFIWDLKTDHVIYFHGLWHIFVHVLTRDSMNRFKF